MKSPFSVLDGTGYPIDDGCTTINVSFIDFNLCQI